MSRICCLLAVAVLLAAGSVGAVDIPQQPGFVSSEFIYETAPNPECHASTIVDTPAGLVAAWFGGTYEKHPDVGIWVSRHRDGRWTAPVEVANGVESPARRYPTWNPVLFQPAAGPLLLFYKAGPSPDTWWGLLTTSTDGGATWSPPQRLPEGILGPVRNKPVQLADGTLLCGSSTEHDGWRVHMERTGDLGRTWSNSGPLHTKEELGAIQPTILRFGGQWHIFCRTQRAGRIAVSKSADDGRTWSPMTLTSLPNPNSGIDGVTLADGRGLLVYNHTPKGRSPLNVAVSTDGVNWTPAVVLEQEPGEYSYPAVIQSADGLVHMTYTWKRKRVRHVVLNPAAWLSAK